MGASSSTEQVPKEQKEIENQAAATGALSVLQKVFSILAVPRPDTIPLASLEFCCQQCFNLEYKNITCKGIQVADCFSGLLHHLPQAITDLHFVTNGGGEICWVDFLRGYVRCCSRISASSLLIILFRVITVSSQKAGCPFKLNFDSDEVDGKAAGSLLPYELAMILWVCWIMSWSCRGLKEQENVILPDLNHLVASAVVSCAEVGSDFNAWDSDVLSLDVELSMGKVHMWVLKTVPNLSDCFLQFVHSRIKRAAFSQSEMVTPSSSTDDVSIAKVSEHHLLTCGRAWAISLSQRSKISEEILNVCFPCKDDMIEQSLLYRSSLHGKGLNRLWSSIEGYHGPLLLLICASSLDANETSAPTRKWIIGALVQQGLENKDGFYGSGGNLYATWPVFQLFSPLGKERNFVYSHLHPRGRQYEQRPVSAGMAFGGTSGNERIFIDEDFANLTVRHHAYDKTYEPGSLFPNQGFLPVQAAVLDVEAWGLGGKSAKEAQISYKNREKLFTEQRRKVDLKTFASWEDSPEKMMMDMVGNPNGVQREER